MPELREDLAASRMHLLGHAPPSFERLGAMKIRDLGMKTRRRMIDEGSFGDDQAYSAFGAPPVVGGHVRAGHSPGRVRARHGRHHDSIPEIESFQLNRPEQRAGRTVQIERLVIEDTGRRDDAHRTTLIEPVYVGPAWFYSSSARPNR